MIFILKLHTPLLCYKLLDCVITIIIIVELYSNLIYPRNMLYFKLVCADTIFRILKLY